MSKNGKVSILDIQDWLEELKENKIIEFEHGKLPKDLQRRKFLIKAKNEGLLKRIRNVNGRNTWRIVDNINSRTNK